MKLFCSCILMAVITLSVVVLTPTKAFGLGLPPLPSLAAAGDNGTVCKDADCQKGTCVANSNNFLNDLLFPYHCDCDPGWTTFQSFLPFLTTSTLPCNIPNCTLNFNCSGSYQSPAPSPQTPAPPPASSDGELEGSCENLGITIPGFTPSSSGSPGSPGTPASNQNATTPSTGCRYALLGGNVLSTGVVVLTTCVYFALFW
ncbi:hypothetical protein CY35_07G099000 [Sphagnum magellanicum]|uniref:Uncharacterized protein n=2 Tax=Sphagnum magellanicum TaxID=128215 RepID=A0ACB8HNA3_9BRYO|nr:hypothetical protein CY35_07G099000 [Sphagnum magellanicum]KAH9557714.1 hypothetical protein CY35_07G099000 [Sphagnum magellanicum]